LRNCNAFAGQIAIVVGLHAPMLTMQYPVRYMSELRALNSGRSKPWKVLASGLYGLLASGKARSSASDMRTFIPANGSILSAPMATTFVPSPRTRPISTWMD
jgi:hypothetical protein